MFLEVGLFPGVQGPTPQLAATSFQVPMLAPCPPAAWGCRGRGPVSPHSQQLRWTLSALSPAENCRLHAREGRGGPLRSHRWLESAGRGFCGAVGAPPVCRARAPGAGQPRCTHGVRLCPFHSEHAPTSRPSQDQALGALGEVLPGRHFPPLPPCEVLSEGAARSVSCHLRRFPSYRANCGFAHPLAIWPPLIPFRRQTYGQPFSPALS